MNREEARTVLMVLGMVVLSLAAAVVIMTASGCELKVQISVNSQCHDTSSFVHGGSTRCIAPEPASSSTR